MLDVDNAGIDPAGWHRIMAPYLQTLRLQMQGSRRSSRIMKTHQEDYFPLYLAACLYSCCYVCNILGKITGKKLAKGYP